MRQPFYHVRCAEAGQTFTFANDVGLAGELTLGDGQINFEDITISGSSATVSPITKTTNTSFNGSNLKFGLIGANRTYQLAGGDYGNAMITAAGNFGSNTLTIELQGDITARILAINGDFGSHGSCTFNSNDHAVTMSEHIWAGWSVVNTNDYVINLGNSSVNIGGDLRAYNRGTINMDAATFSIGQTISLWRNGGSRDGVINFGTSTVVLDGSADKVFLSDNDIDIGLYNLELNTTGTITMSTDVRVTNQLTLTRGIVTPTLLESFVIGENTSIVGGSSESYFAGPLRKVTNSTSPFTFLVGKNGRIRRATIRPTTADVTEWEVEYFPAPPPSGTMQGGIEQVMQLEYWEIDRISGTADAHVRLSWRNFEVPDPSKTVVAHWTGAEWENLGGSTSDNGEEGEMETTTAASSFSPFALASTDPSNTLPVELLYFDGFSTEMDNQLQWATASEKDNDYFEIQRSRGGLTYETVGYVMGAGNSDARIDYQYIDSDPPGVTNYYRLRQVDFDGSEEFSRVVSIQRTVTSLPIYPNPATDYVMAVMPAEAVWSVYLYDMGGNLLVTESIEGQQIRMDLRSLSKGLYLLKILSGPTSISGLIKKD